MMRLAIAKTHNGPFLWAAADDDHFNTRLALLARTDLGNAERFRERFKDRIVWCHGLGWLALNEKGWTRDNIRALIMLAEHATVRAIQSEARAIKNTENDVMVRHDRLGKPVMLSEALEKWGRISEGVHRMKAIALLARPYLSFSLTTLPAPFLTNNNKRSPPSIRS